MQAQVPSLRGPLQGNHRLVQLLALCMALSVGCDPGSCQGDVETPLNTAQNDDFDVVPLCEGNNTEIKDDVNIKNNRELLGLAGCERIEGILTIEGASDIADLSPLSALREIDQGYFLAINNTGLVTIDLPNLERVDYGIGVINNPDVTTVSMAALGTQDAEGITFGDITLRDNASLQNVQFPAVQEIKTDQRLSPGSLILGNNPSLTNLSGFQSLERIEGILTIFGNHALTNLSGLDALNEIANNGNVAQGLAIGIDFDNENNIIAAGNDGLTTLDGLNELDIINGDVFIGFNNALQDLNGIDDLATLPKNLFIAGNGALENLSGLEGDNNGDGDDDGLSNVTGSIFIGLFFDRFGQPVAAGNNSLDDVEGLNSLTTLGGSLVLAFNQQLSQLDGLDALPSIGGDLVIVGSRQLDSFAGAQALTTITGSLVFGQLFSNTQRIIQPADNNGEVDPERDEMADVTGVAVDDTGTAVDLETDFSTGFPLLSSIGKDLVFAFSDFDNLSIAQNLSNVGGRLVVHGCAAPADLTGLESINTLGGLSVGLAVDKRLNLIPSGNSAFAAFTGLNINALGAGGLAIGFNDDLNDLGTLGQLNNVVGDVTIAETDVTSLVDLDIVSIDGDLNIGAIVNGDNAPLDGNLDAITALNMDELQDVGGNVFVAFTDNLVDASLPVLTTVVGALELTSQNELVTIDGSNQLQSVGTLLLHDLVALETVNLPGLDSTDGDIHVVDNPQVETLSFAALTAVGGTLELRNLGINTVAGFDQLQTVGDVGAASGDLLLIDLQDLNDVTGLANVNSVGGNFSLVDVPSVNDVTFTDLVNVGGSVELIGLEQPIDLEGLEQLTTIGDALRIEDCASLETLKGLEGLTTIGRVLSLKNNPELDVILRDEDVPDQVDVVNGVEDQGLLRLSQVGDPDFIGVGGDRGVIEAKDNPRVREEDLVNLVEDFAEQFEGFFVLCGNEDSGQDENVPSDAQCL